MPGSPSFISDGYEALRAQVIQILFRLLRRTEKGRFNKSFYGAHIIFTPTKRHEKEYVGAHLPQQIQQKKKKKKGREREKDRRKENFSPRRQPRVTNDDAS